MTSDNSPLNPETPPGARSWRSPRNLVAIGLGAALVVGVPVGFVLTSGDGAAPNATVTASASPTVSPSLEPTASASSDLTPGEAWMALSETERPPMLTDQDSREPHAREMQNWVWDYVDESWSLEIVREINNQYDPEPVPVVNPFQTLFLVSPDDEYLRLFELRTDIGVYVMHFAPGERLAFLSRQFYEESQVIQFDLLTGEADETWAESGFPASDTSHREGRFIQYDATLPDGREVWDGFGYGSPIEGVFFRTPGEGVAPSAIGPTLISAPGEGFYCMGIDIEDETAVYTAQEYAWETETWTSSFIVHDLVADTWSQYDRNGILSDSCHEAFDVTPEYWVGLANSVDQQGLYRVYFDGRPDELIG